MSPDPSSYGIVLLDKPAQKTSFHLVSFLRKLTSVKKIGHAGTLDPFATGLMVMLVGKPFTKLSNLFLKATKSYVGLIHLGQTTDSYDIDGQVLTTSDYRPSETEVKNAIETHFQGEIDQIPPMFSAKKVDGKKLYELARKGIEIPRQSKKVRVQTTLLRYEYPFIEIDVSCSSGTYIRSIAHDLGQILGCGAFLETLRRTRVGPFLLEDAQSCQSLTSKDDLHLRKLS